MKNQCFNFICGYLIIVFITYNSVPSLFLVLEMKYTQRTYSFSSTDGLTLLGQSWFPEIGVRAEVIFVHGIGEHSGRYESLAQNFCLNGIAVHAFDLRGHGHSQGKRGVIHHLNDFLNDLSSFDHLIGHSLGDVPRFLYGHSMGGTLALSYLSQRNHHFAGAVISSPWLGLTHPPAGWFCQLVRWCDDLIPAFTVFNGIHSWHLTSDVVEQDVIINDYLLHNRISIRLFNCMSCAIAELLEHPQRVNLPVLLLHGSADPVTDCNVTERFAASVEMASFITYQGAKHELHHEKIKNQVFEDVMAWMEPIILKHVV